MFLEYYGLRQQPFGVTPDPAYLYPSRTHSEALASLSSGIREGRGFFALVAQPGMGKTTLLYQLMEELRETARVAYLFQTQCDIREFLQYLLAELNVDARGMGLVALHNKLNEALFAEMLGGKRFVLIVDEAQNLEDPVLETVRLLSNFETTHTKLLQIVLAGQPELAVKLEHPKLAQLRQRIAVLAHLERLSPEAVRCYIEHRLKVAGYQGEPLFSDGAVAIIAEASQGIPRNINNLCFHALSFGCTWEMKEIPESVARNVAKKLGFVVAPATEPVVVGRALAEPAKLAAPVHEPRGIGSSLTYEGPTSFLQSRWALVAVAAMVLIVFGASARAIWKLAGPGLTRAAALPKSGEGALSSAGSGYAQEFGPAPFNAAPEQTDAGQILTVVVMPGQTLREVATNYTGRYDDSIRAQVRTLNPQIDIDHLQPGQLIRVPLPSGMWKKSFDSEDSAAAPSQASPAKPAQTP